MKKIVVFLSGGGSNLQALIDACGSGDIAGEIVGVVSNRKAAYGLVRAADAGIETLYFPLGPYRKMENGRDLFSAELATLIRDKWNPDLIVLAGYMLILTAPFLSAFPKRIINQHPAMPGTFVGTHCVERSFEAWQRGEVSHGGCMIHYAIPEVDAGDVLMSAMVPILVDDTLETFSARLHQREHQAIVMGTQIALEAIDS